MYLDVHLGMVNLNPTIMMYKLIMIIIIIDHQFNLVLHFYFAMILKFLLMIIFYTIH